VSCLDGAWRRVSVTVLAERPVEVSDVWWLVCHGTFADLRVLRTPGGEVLPYSATQAFAGTCSRDPRTGDARWDAEVDTVDRPAVVNGALHPDPRDARVLTEVGEDFTETWVRMDADGAPAAALREAGVVLVAVGPYAVAVGPTGGARFQRAASGWVLLDEVGAAPLAAGDVDGAERSGWTALPVPTG